jgi:hypothetical protein
LNTVRAPRSRAANLRVSSSWSPRFTVHFNIAPWLAGRAVAALLSPPAILVTWRQCHSQHIAALRELRALSETTSRSVIDRSVHHATTRLRRLQEARFLEVRRTFLVHAASKRFNGSPRPLRAPAHADRQRDRGPLRLELKAAITPLLRRWRAPAAMSYANRRTGAATLAKPAAAPSPARLRALELVWRAEPEWRGAEASERQAGALQLTAPVAAAASFRQPDPVPMRSASIGQHLLDPSLIDRVAEDVIGRVERRIRIERERRGV